MKPTVLSLVYILEFVYQNKPKKLLVAREQCRFSLPAKDEPTNQIVEVKQIVLFQGVLVEAVHCGELTIVVYGQIIGRQEPALGQRDLADYLEGLPLRS